MTGTAPATGATPADAPPTSAADPAGTPAAGTSTAPGAAALWRRHRGAAAVLGILLVSALALAALDRGTRYGHLDPRSAAPTGSRAVAELLRERGVTTRVVTTAREAADAAGPRTTLLVTRPDLLGETQLRSLRTAADLSGGRTVLLGPGARSLPTLAPGVHAEGSAAADDPAPACTLPAAVSAGRASTGSGLRYSTTRPGAVSCYPSGGRPTLLVLPAGTTGTSGGDTVVLGSETALLNESLAEEGNASLALQLLGSRPDLVWYLPSLTDADAPSATEDKALFDLVPAGWSWALLQLFLAAALAALWRSRRLGPLVTEHLPVAIRASETTEGRARLYRKAGARDRAAAVLRGAARGRLAALTGVPASRADDPAALVPSVAARLPDTRDVTSLLFGPAPSDDAALVALADHLDALEREVRTS
ncbi:DUF4350 domain-containing protein [Streptomyces sp. cmx-4-9]|uniref:DUF4350 domain-containing protein n=1 Tax=Streptomyces sp. cmx-4-9 TaxID=2790941 RepID=UPI0039808539